MTVRELIEELEKLPQNLEVILQKDAEGNGYSPLRGVDDACIYVADCSWCGEVYDIGWTADEAGMDEDAWNGLLVDNPRCVVLFPVN